jgi:cyclopropane-fatty-acyl-phospholipid synthase
MTMTIGEVVDRLFPTGLLLRVEAYDGSIGGDRAAPVTLRILNERGLRYLVTAPGELGLVRAYVMGDLEVDPIDPGDPYEVLTRTMDKIPNPTLRASEVPELLRGLGRSALRRPPLPPQEAPGRLHRLTSGLVHGRKRDAEAISHHYDVSNRFYEMVLGPSMAYTCAVYPTEDATLEQAQEHKHDLVCRKLGLGPGMRLLDVGCGWGGMVMHAVRHHGVEALGVTLSKQQALWAQKAISDAGLSHAAEVRFMDYRDVTETGFDAISSIGLTEHIGVANYPAYFRTLYDKLKPGGRLLNHCITRPDNQHNGALRAVGLRGSFIDRYIFPDGELAGSGTIVSVMEDTGFEVQHHESFRQHYARTCRAWARNLSANWQAAVAEVGEAKAKIWGLYLSGSSHGFETNVVQLHQVLGSKLDADHDAHYPLRHAFGV